MSLKILALVGLAGLTLLAIGVYWVGFRKNQSETQKRLIVASSVIATVFILTLAMLSVPKSESFESSVRKYSSIECEATKTSSHINADPPTERQHGRPVCQKPMSAVVAEPLGLSGPASFTVHDALADTQTFETITVTINGSIVGTVTLTVEAPEAKFAGVVPKPGSYDYQVSGLVRMKDAQYQNVRLYGVGSVEIHDGVELVLVLYSFGGNDARVGLVPR